MILKKPLPRVELGPAWYQQHAGLHVLKLQGSAYQMGWQHGRLLREAIPSGPLHNFRTYVRRLLRRQGLGWLTPLAWQALRLLVGRRVQRRLPAEVREAAQGLAEGADVPLMQVLDAVSMPDVLLWLAARMQRKLDRATAHRLALSLGCSSALAWGSATHDGRLLHARNFDYHGVDCWDRESAVIFYEPEEGQRYVSVASAGVFLGGVTAMNSAGLTLTMHQHMFSDGTRLGGTPAGVVGDQVMRHARTLDEAQEILAAHQPIGCFSYVIGSGHERQVLCHEENPARNVSLRYGADRPAEDTAPDTFRYTNIYIDGALGESEKDLYPSYWRHNQARWQRLGALLEEAHGELDSLGMASMLADNDEQSGCRVRGALAMLMTVGSVVMRPEDGAFWVATGAAPVSRNRFEPFSLRAEGAAPELGALEPARDPASDSAFAAYKRAYLACFERNDPHQARQELASALEQRPDEPCYQGTAGLLALICDDAGSAEAPLRRAVQLGHPDLARVASFQLWLGWALDLQGRREQALEAYTRVLADPTADARVHAAARRDSRRPFNRRRARALNIEFAYADIIQP